MGNEVQRIMLIDDNTIDNFFNQRAIQNFNPGIKVTEKRNVKDALEYLENAGNEDFPDLIFLDISMPKYSGWDFLDAYNERYANKKTRITILTSSEDPLDLASAQILGISLKNKPLKASLLDEIINNKGGYAAAV
ncbi:response regulator [Flavobacterium psychrotrophum]|uniref:response regulator n=1 Tax=Flavobacterium psychrotrophum TaxID=2294119 RepID=UPI000E313A77|nr:response regulator [Flavobacterium psychrotrophum]